ncbi:MAG TPA: hypothetical protein VHR41_19520 [Gemmatimonadales bacterium]|nr:hypothetical protein [Gemmatimonadales bacterium]
MRPFFLLVPLALLGTHTAPKSGEDLVRQMHAKYAGKWYHNLTFEQTTTHPEGPPETWYEAGTIPGKLRIDIAPLDSMNAFMYVGDSSIIFRGGKRVAAHQDRNLLMTLGFDVYGQPPETTIAQLKAQSMDLSKIREDNWNGTRIWVVGADKGDTTTNQFWIEQKRMLFVRLIEAHQSQKNPGAPPDLLDITFENYQPLAKAWVAPRCVIKLNGKEVQREEYRNIRADAKLQPDLYDTETYHKAAWIEAK